VIAERALHPVRHRPQVGPVFFESIRHPVPDEIWMEAARHYDEPALAALMISISLINVWNRLNVATRQVAGEWLKSAEAQTWVESR
jgi:hypothetical protein